MDYRQHFQGEVSFFENYTAIAANTDLGNSN